MEREILINGKVWRHHFVTGTVASAVKQLETKVSGGGGGGYSHQGTGYTAPVQISSTTTTHDNIFLVDGTGKEHAIRLQNWDLSVRETHQLTAIWLTKRNGKGAPYVAIYNATLGETDYNENLLDKYHRPLWPALAGAFPLMVDFGLVTLLLLGGGFLTRWIMGIQGRKRLIASGQLLRMAGA